MHKQTWVHKRPKPQPKPKVLDDVRLGVETQASKIIARLKNRF